MKSWQTAPQIIDNLASFPVQKNAILASVISALMLTCEQQLVTPYHQHFKGALDETY